MKMSGKYNSGIILAVVFIVIGGIYVWPGQKKYLYVGGSDLKGGWVYEIDFINNQIQRKDWLDKRMVPLAIDKCKDQLFVGGRAIIGGEVNPGIEVINLLQKKRIRKIKIDGAVRNIVASPSCSHLYISNPELDEETKIYTLKIETESGRVIDRLHQFILPFEYFVDEGNSIFFASPFAKTKYSLTGDTYVYEYTNKNEILKSGGLYYRDGKPAYPLVMVDKNKTAEVNRRNVVKFYDRKSLEVIKEIPLEQEVNGFFGTDTLYPPISPDGKYAAVGGGGEINDKNKRIIFILNLQELEIEKKIDLGSRPKALSNLVWYYSDESFFDALLGL